MLTQVNKAVVVEPTNVFSAGAPNENSELAVLADGGKDASGRADRGPILVRSFDPFPPRDYRRGDFNPERIILNDPVARDNDLAPLPEAQVGDRFDTSLTAVVDYSFGNYKFLVTEVPPIVRGRLTPERAKPAGKDELASRPTTSRTSTRSTTPSACRRSRARSSTTCARRTSSR